MSIDTDNCEYYYIVNGVVVMPIPVKGASDAEAEANDEGEKHE